MNGSLLPLVETPTKKRVRRSSVDAHKETKTKRETTETKVLHIVRTAQMAGYRDLTRREILAMYSDTFGPGFDPSQASARVNALLKKGFLEEGEFDRKCSVTGREVSTVRCPMKQGSFL